MVFPRVIWNFIKFSKLGYTPPFPKNPEKYEKHLRFSGFLNLCTLYLHFVLKSARADLCYYVHKICVHQNGENEHSSTSYVVYNIFWPIFRFWSNGALLYFRPIHRFFREIWFSKIVQEKVLNTKLYFYSAEFLPQALFKTTFLGTCLPKNVKEFEFSKVQKAISISAPNCGFGHGASKKLKLSKTHFLKNCFRALFFLKLFWKIVYFT